MRFDRRLVLLVLFLTSGCSGAHAVGSAPVPAAVVADAARLDASTARSGSGGGTIVLHAYDATGKRLTWSAFRALQENQKGSNGDNDAVLDATTLRVRTMWPLFSQNGDPALTLPPQSSALALAWPTSDGYSNLIINLPSTGGTYVFDVLAAKQVVGDLDAALAARPAYAPSAAVRTAAAQAHASLATATSAPDEASQGAAGAKALDAAAHGLVLLLQDAGLQNARALRATSVPAWGVTFDDISGGASALQGAANLYGHDGSIRIVFDRSEPASYYAAEVAEAQRLGLHVVGQILDSSDMSAVSESAWQQRVASYVTTLPSVDEWEIGNEVNGNWLGSGVAAKIAYAAAYVKQHARGRTLVTLYWQLGEDDAAHSMYTWAAANLAPLAASIDDLGISLYPEDHPMGAALERAMTTLHAQYPAQRVMITELDYWSSDLGHTWWWGSSTDPFGSGRTAVGKLYQSATYAYPYAGGGTFWWYYLEESPPGSALWQTFSALHAGTL